MDEFPMAAKVGAGAVAVVITYIVALVLFEITLWSITSYERWQRERAEGHRCLVWGSK